MKILVLMLAALLIFIGSACLAEEIPAEGMQIIQLRDPFEAEMLEDRIQKYFSLDTSYDYKQETMTIWTTLGFRKDIFDISFTWDQQVNPSEPGTATLSLNLWW